MDLVETDVETVAIAPGWNALVRWDMGASFLKPRCDTGENSVTFLKENVHALAEVRFFLVAKRFLQWEVSHVLSTGLCFGPSGALGALGAPWPSDAPQVPESGPALQPPVQPHPALPVEYPLG